MYFLSLLSKVNKKLFSENIYDLNYIYLSSLLRTMINELCEPEKIISREITFRQHTGLCVKFVVKLMTELM